MKIYDFDAKFYDYVRTWMALHPGLREDQVEEKYNEMMLSWLNAPAQWLNGVKPGEYFNRYDDPKDLIKLMQEYLKRDIGLPEPLYSRIVAMGEDCAPYLLKIVQNSDNAEALRGTAMAMLNDMEDALPASVCVELIFEDDDALADMAVERLKALGDASVVDTLLDRYDGAAHYARMSILDVCARFPGNDRVFDLLTREVVANPDVRGLAAGLLADYGDPRAVEPLKRVHQMADLGYMDYIEVRNAIEALGGDPGEERVFNGDPDYEVLRNL